MGNNVLRHLQWYVTPSPNTLWLDLPPYSAEMALATLNGVPVPGLDPPWTLTLSHTSSLDSALPKEPLCAQYVKVPSGSHVLQRRSAQDIFRFFRVAGPLVLVQTNIDVGYPNPTCVVEYWEEEHALYALRNARTLHPTFLGMPTFVLRTFAQYSVLGTVSMNSTIWLTVCSAVLTNKYIEYGQYLSPS